MLLGSTLTYYKRRDIADEMVGHAWSKEVGIRYTDSFGKRPDTLNYAQDVLEFAKNKATSFHASEELWKNPLHLRQEMTRRELDDLRTGWDLVLDIDCHVFEYSKISAYFVIKALRHHGISSVSVKFSGNKGFHIGVPFEAFPSRVGGTETRLLFPEAPQRIAAYLKFLISDLVANAILRLEKGDFSAVATKTGLSREELATTSKDEEGRTVQKLAVDKFLVIDTILIASRHLYRMPYSLHEKSGLASIPFEADHILRFDKGEAEPEKVKAGLHFLGRDKAIPGEASPLIVQAFDFSAKPKEGVKERKAYEDVDDGTAIPEPYFPPCIHNILKGVKDGRKRSVFILRNFLSMANWKKEAIADFIMDWNRRSPDPIREVIIKGQIRYAGQKVMPPNCDNTAYYKDFGVCTPDNFCQRIRNPYQYAKLKVLLTKRNRGGRKKKEQQEGKGGRQGNSEQEDASKNNARQNSMQQSSMQQNSEQQDNAPRTTDGQRPTTSQEHTTPSSSRLKNTPP